MPNVDQWLYDPINISLYIRHICMVITCARTIITLFLKIIQWRSHVQTTLFIVIEVGNKGFYTWDNILSTLLEMVYLIFDL